MNLGPSDPRTSSRRFSKPVDNNNNKNNNNNTNWHVWDFESVDQAEAPDVGAVFEIEPLNELSGTRVGREPRSSA